MKLRTSNVAMNIDLKDKSSQGESQCLTIIQHLLVCPAARCTFSNNLPNIGGRTRRWIKIVRLQRCYSIKIELRSEN